MEKNLKSYLSGSFTSSVNDIKVDDDKITIKGSASVTSNLFLCEVTPYNDVTEETSFETALPVKFKKFNFSVDRFVKRNGFNYDRLLSKWVLAQKTTNGFKVRSHAHFPDDIKAQWDLPYEKAKSKKGLGGFSTTRGHIEDLDELNITSATVNIWFAKFMFIKPAAGRIKHVYNGKQYYFGQKQVEMFDSTFTTTARKGIITAAILLVDKAEDCPDKEIGRLLQHPDMDPAGIYSMPNMTNPASVDCYAAALDFFAARYSRPDKKYGRLNHWIMHNEVDAGWEWTNMGEKSATIFMDTYIKSMRMCYAIARKYNPHSEVFVSLTHYWAWTSHPRFYPSKDLMEILLQYTRSEGDFHWSVAQHPYPESLFEPKTWLDKQVSFDFNSPLITFKNLEVLNAWIKQPEVLYKGKIKRTLWLSENGTNSKTYSAQDLKEQAAGFAYTWKKMEALDGIDGFQWHNWFDHPGEGGLRIGLRRFPDDETDPGGAKPVWYVFKAAGNPDEDAVFNQYKETIGIKSWDEVRYKGEIGRDKKDQSYLDLKSDTWEATDALGRSLPGFAEVGHIKKDRYVGMFYFLTHNDAGKDGPSDVTKIKAANPENPEWGKGTHYWGEPEFGYYLSIDKWVIRRHAEMLTDAGVDVIIFDCTNNLTYPEVTKTIFEVFNEMRAEGERTPDIAFMASEKSVYQVWDQIYSKGLNEDLWFKWKGKPLLLFGQWTGIKPMNEVLFPSEIENFFSIRNSWAWTTLPWYKNEGKDMWPWIDHYPQHVGWHESKNEGEYVPVAAAQHPLSNIGRSFHDGNQPPIDKYDLTPDTDKGLHFSEQWKRALQVNPEFVFVTGWNEWTAGRQTLKEDVEKELKVWDFFPGAKLGKAGKPLKPGDVYFIDQYNQEYSRDIEPMNAGHTDDYYYQLMANIRRYKGIRPPEEPASKTINITGDFKQWDNTLASYYDHIGDTEYRDSPGNFQAGPYINTTGRNDIVRAQVTHDQNNLYFYIETKQSLTPLKGKNWMLIFIDADQNKATGWQGYDYAINSKVINATTTTISQLDKNGKFRKSVNIPLKVEGNRLMLSVPRKAIKSENKLQMEFHIADNINKIGDIMEFFSNGDSAPSRRANYLYATAKWQTRRRSVLSD